MYLPATTSSTTWRGLFCRINPLFIDSIVCSRVGVLLLPTTVAKIVRPPKRIPTMEGHETNKSDDDSRSAHSNTCLRVITRWPQICKALIESNRGVEGIGGKSGVAGQIIRGKINAQLNAIIAAPSICDLGADDRARYKKFYRVFSSKALNRSFRNKKGTHAYTRHYCRRSEVTEPICDRLGAARDKP
jgi:hypothetical protein